MPLIDIKGEFGEPNAVERDSDETVAEWELNEFSVDDMRKSRELETMAVVSLLAAFAYRYNGGNFDFMGKPVAEWRLPQVVALSQATTGLTVKYSKDLYLGEFDRSDYERACTFPINVLKYALRGEKLTGVESHTPATLADLIYATKGVVAHGYGVGSNMVMRLTIPGYSAEGRVPVDIGIFGEYSGRVVGGGKEYVDWFNANNKAQLRYRHVPTLIVKLAALVHQRVATVADPGGSLKFRDRVFPSTPDPFALVKNCDGFVRAACIRMVEAWKDIKERPSWAPTGNKEEHVIEWMMMGAYGPMLVNEAAMENLERVYDKVEEKVREQCALIWAALGPLGVTFSDSLSQEKQSEFCLDVLKAIWHGRAKTYNDKTVIQKYSQASQMVEASRLQERTHDKTTVKVDTHPFGIFAGAHSSVPLKIKNALGELSRAMGAKVKFNEVHAIGTGKGCHWESTVEGIFADTPILYSDLSGDCTPQLGGKFVRKDVLDPQDVPPGSGVGKILVSDAFPGESVAKAQFGMMMKNYLSADYDAGIIKCYLGSDLEADTFVRYGHAPPYVTDWAKKYRVTGFTPGGGHHSQEYFFVFGRRVVDWKIDKGEWIPNSPSEPLAVYSAEAPPTEDACAKHVDRVVKYASLFLTAKVADMVRANAWKGPLALNGIRGDFPLSFGKKGALLEYHSPGTGLRLTGKGHVRGVVKADTGSVVLVPYTPGDVEVKWK